MSENICKICGLPVPIGAAHPHMITTPYNYQIHVPNTIQDLVPVKSRVEDISDEVLAKISMWVNSESEVVSNLKLEIEELKHRLKLANTIIDELIEVAEVHVDDTFEKINELNKLQGEK